MSIEFLGDIANPSISSDPDIVGKMFHQFVFLQLNFLPILYLRNFSLILTLDSALPDVISPNVALFEALGKPFQILKFSIIRNSFKSDALCEIVASSQGNDSENNGVEVDLVLNRLL